MTTLITPLDGSPPAEAAVALSARMADRLNASIELVHVVGVSSPEDRPAFSSAAEAERYLLDVARRFSINRPVQVRALEGRPIDELLRFVHRSNNAIVVMSRHGHSSLRRSHFGSVTVGFIHGVNVPVLVADPHELDADPWINDILVPLDGSELADSALPLAVNILGDRGRLCLVRVVRPPDESTQSESQPAPPSRHGDLRHQVSQVAIDEARGFLLQTAQKLRQRGLSVGWEVRFGNPASEIVRASETAGAQIIVMATHGLGGARQWTLGSVTDLVVRHATVPILVIPPRMSHERVVAAAVDQAS